MLSPGKSWDSGRDRAARHPLFLLSTKTEGEGPYDDIKQLVLPFVETVADQGRIPMGVGRLEESGSSESRGGG